MKHRYVLLVAGQLLVGGSVIALGRRYDFEAAIIGLVILLGCSCVYAYLSIQDDELWQRRLNETCSAWKRSIDLIDKQKIEQPVELYESRLQHAVREKYGERP